jgi:hypothetical protein
VTETTRVEIKPGWLINQFAEFVLGIDPGHSPVKWALNKDFGEALKRLDALVVQKDFQYQGSWQTLGEVIPTADLIDKLARLDSATKSGAVLSWDPDKRRGILFDIIVRAFMILAWEGVNFTDDDLDEPAKA